MSSESSQISVVIPTYRRGQVLLDTIRFLRDLPVRPDEILVVDQTELHTPEMLTAFQTLEKTGCRRIVLSEPSIPRAMNVGLQEAKGRIVLFLDDDIVPDEALISAHLKAHEDSPEASAVVGQVLQPEENFETTVFTPKPSKNSLRRDVGFRFNSVEAVWVENVMAGNLSVKKDFALRVGGFDENFVPPVSFRFETEFAKRVIASGGKIRFEPTASIRHLRAGQGGTRSRGSHLTSVSPIHGVGDYYYAWLYGKGVSRLTYIAIRPFRQVRTKFHLLHPWYIPVKLIGELRAIAMGLSLLRRGPRLLNGSQRVVLISTVQPDRPNGSMVRYGAMIRNALEQHTRYAVEELSLSPTQAWLDRFPGFFQTPLRYLCIAWNARRLLPRQRGARLHLLDGSHAYLLGAVRKISCPLVITVHDLIPILCMNGELKGVKPGRGAQWILKHAVKNLSRADVVASVSENTRRDVCRIAGVSQEKTCTVHSAVDVLTGSNTMLTEETPYILHVAGNNNFYKNRLGVIRIFEKIRERVPVRLKMVGAPPDERLRKQISSSGLEMEIEFCTHVSEETLADLYRNAVFFLFPSLYEGFGWPPLEAMALGCPVLCSNAGSLAEIAGDAAWTSSPDDLQGFTDYGIQLLQDAEERQRRVEAGLKQVDNFGLQQLADGLVAAYDLAEQRFAE